MRPLYFLPLLFLLPACNFFGQREYEPNPDPNHTHIDFAVYVEGMKIDFGDNKYMAGVLDHPHLHLHDEIGYLLHRHKPGLTFGEFLSSLGFTMSTQCLTLDTNVMVCPEREKAWQMFVNGAETSYDAGYVFEDMDQILITYGADAKDVQKQLSEMTDDACLYSKTCPWRGDPPAENCIADPEVPCVAPLD